MYMETADANIRPLQRVQNGASWANIRHYLRNRNPSVYRQLNPDHKGPEEFKFVGRDPLSFWLGRRPHVSGNDAGAIGIHWGGDNLATLLQRAEQNIEALTSAERWRLADYWLQDMREEQTDRLFERINAAERNQADITAVHSEVDRRALAQAHVIGLTTTALAKNITLLRRIRPKVVICEEAGEVMEPHVLSAMMPGVEHLIQIGDHRQLRPQINDFSLSSESSSGMTYQLDRSQFERRAMGEPGLAAIPIAQLNVQRRMRPEISNLIRHVYPNLEDHESVQGMPDVVGMRKNLFWLDHDHHEDSTNDGVRVRSHSNQWEVDMASGLVRHLVRQGRYNSSDIALLTPYTGQLRKLRHALSKDFEIFLSDRDQDTLAAEGVLDDMAEEKDVVMDQESAGADRKMKNQGTRSLVKKALAQTLRLATVDNFQGEEAKVIIVSLVRSNAAHKVGFLRTENRINVLLSRAQHGMYLIGSSETYLHVPMWSKVHSQLVYSDSVGTSIPLCCPRHPEKDILCAEPEDFARKSPEGGCDLSCQRRLEECGHRCQARCHSEMMHKTADCPQPCMRLRATCDHTCVKLCSQDCGPCLINVGDKVLPCGHIEQDVACHRTLDLGTIKCHQKVTRTVPGCGHSVQVKCHVSLESESFRCPTPCGEPLSCGHACTGTCGTCRKQDHDGGFVLEHRKCTKVCDRPHGVCNHRCSKTCHTGEACGGCTKNCEVRSYCPFKSFVESFSFWSTCHLLMSPIADCHICCKGPMSSLRL